MTAPDFIWARLDPSSLDASGATRLLAMDDEFRKSAPYVRDDPEALVQSAHVQALISAAVLDGQLRAFERGRLDTPDELRGLDAEAALDRMLQEARRDEREKMQSLLQRAYDALGEDLHLDAFNKLARDLERAIQEPPR
jgi:hypothetical protein